MALLLLKKKKRRTNINARVVAIPPKVNLENVVELPEKKFVLAVLVNTLKSVAKLKDTKSGIKIPLFGILILILVVSGIFIYQRFWKNSFELSEGETKKKWFK